MGGNCAESTPSEATAVEIDGKLYHLVGRDGLSLVFGVWQAGIWKVEGMVNLFLCHRREHGVDDDITDSLVAFIPFADALCFAGNASHLRVGGIVAFKRLDEPFGLHAVAFLLDVSEVFRMGLPVGKACFVAGKYDVVRRDATGNILAFHEGHSLADGVFP